AAVGGGGAAFTVAALAPPLLVGLLTFDYTGSTPLVASAHHEGGQWRITLDPERCAGVYRCWEVCPEACFEKPEAGGKIILAHDERCVRCGACVVQCPKDALYFEDGQGGRVEPDTIRRFKLNLLGRRAVRVPARTEQAEEESGPAA
ncbi:MAG: ferredoxin family protein, partial [Myxococcota bacterium]